MIIWLLYFLFTQCNRVERNQTFSILVLMAFSVFFWALFEQAASSITLFTDRNVQLIDGVSAGMFQALNPFFIVLFAPVFAYCWVYLNKKNIEPNATIKFAIAILFISIGFFSLVVGSGLAGDDFKVSLVFLVVMYLFHTFGELCLSPVGLSMVTRLSIARIAGLMMGIWFLSSSFGRLCLWSDSWINGYSARYRRHRKQKSCFSRNIQFKFRNVGHSSTRGLVLSVFNFSCSRKIYERLRFSCILQL